MRARPWRNLSKGVSVSALGYRQKCRRLGRLTSPTSSESPARRGLTDPRSAGSSLSIRVADVTFPVSRLSTSGIRSSQSSWLVFFGFPNPARGSTNASTPVNITPPPLPPHVGLKSYPRVALKISSCCIHPLQGLLMSGPSVAIIGGG